MVPEQYLLLYALITVVHVFIILGARSALIFSGQKKPTEFNKSRFATEETFVGRVAASHANCLENMPLFAVVVLTNRVLNGPDISFLSGCLLTARVAQIGFHWMGVTETHITLRFYSFFAQLLLLLTIGWKTFQSAAA